MQLTARILALLFSLFVVVLLFATLLAYRWLVEMPNHEANVRGFQARELASLRLTLDKEFELLKTLNWDYAVWDDTHRFMTLGSGEYISSNYSDDTFTSIGIDAVYIYEPDGVLVWHRGFDSIEETHLRIPELELERFPANKKVLPDTTAPDVGQRHGFLATSAGPVMFSSTPVLRSDRTGPAAGVLLFARKVRPELLDRMSALSQVGLSLHDPGEVPAGVQVPPLGGGLQGEVQAESRWRMLMDVHGNPVLALQVTHQFAPEFEFFDKQVLVTLSFFLLVPMLAWFAMHRWFVQPLRTAAKAIRGMTESEDYHHIKATSRIAELRDLRRNFNTMVDRVVAQREQLKQLTLTDGLTRIANRRAMDLSLARSISSMKRTGSPLAVMLCDVDHFKPFNDHYGHQAGDDALIAIADALKNAFTRENDLVARYGGEEFAVVLENLDPEDVRSVADKALQAIREIPIRHEYSSCSDGLTMSMGCVIVREWPPTLPSHAAETLLKQADQALYEAKEGGRNQYRIVEASLA